MHSSPSLALAQHADLHLHRSVMATTRLAGTPGSSRSASPAGRPPRVSEGAPCLHRHSCLGTATPPSRSRRTSCHAFGLEAAVLSPPPAHMMAADVAAFEASVVSSTCYAMYGVPLHAAPPLVSHPGDAAAAARPSSLAVAAALVGAGADVSGLASCLVTPVDPGPARPADTSSWPARSAALASAGGRSVVHLQSANEIAQGATRYGEWVRRSRRMRRVKLMNGMLATSSGSGAALGKSVDELGWVDRLGASFGNRPTATQQQREDAARSSIIKAFSDGGGGYMDIVHPQASYIHCPI